MPVYHKTGSTDCERILHRLLIWDSPAQKLSEHNNLFLLTKCTANPFAFSAQLYSSDLFHGAYRSVTHVSTEHEGGGQLVTEATVEVHCVAQRPNTFQRCAKKPSLHGDQLAHTQVTYFFFIIWFVKTTFKSSVLFHICRLA